MKYHKICTDECGLLLPQSAFAYNGGTGKLRTVCKKCYDVKAAAARREKRRNDPLVRQKELDRCRAYREKYSDGYRQHRLKKRKNRKEKYYTDLRSRCSQLITSARARAVKKGLPFELDTDTLVAIIRVQGHKCSVTGTPFDISESTTYSRSPLAPSIDRRNSDLGYTWDNVQIVVGWYNVFKNEWSDDDAKKFIKIAYHSMFGECDSG